MGVNQSDRQASVRTVTGTIWDYDGDWSALFDAAAIPAGDFNGRLLAWINIKLAASYTNLPSAQAALAAGASAPDWNGLGTFSASTGAFSPSLIFSDARNSQYAPLIS